MATIKLRDPTQVSDTQLPYTYNCDTLAKDIGIENHYNDEIDGVISSGYSTVDMLAQSEPCGYIAVKQHPTSTMRCVLNMLSYHFICLLIDQLLYTQCCHFLG